MSSPCFVYFYSFSFTLLSSSLLLILFSPFPSPSSLGFSSLILPALFLNFSLFLLPLSLFFSPLLCSPPFPLPFHSYFDDSSHLRPFLSPLHQLLSSSILLVLSPASSSSSPILFFSFPSFFSFLTHLLYCLLCPSVRWKAPHVEGEMEQACKYPAAPWLSILSVHQPARRWGLHHVKQDGHDIQPAGEDYGCNWDSLLSLPHFSARCLSSCHPADSNETRSAHSDRRTNECNTKIHFYLLYSALLFHTSSQTVSLKVCKLSCCIVFFLLSYYCVQALFIDRGCSVRLPFLPYNLKYSLGAYLV